MALGSPDVKQLRKALLKGYDKDVIPVKKDATPIPLQIGLSLKHLNIDEDSSMFLADVWVQLKWKDHQLSWNPDDYGSVKILPFAPEDIWIPDIVLYNK